MKVCAYYGPDSFEVEDRPVPEIGDDEILVKTDTVGICGTDIHKAVHQTVKEGTILGHEISGVVDAVGANVSKFKVGDKVAIAHHAPCMSCKACLKGHHSLCEQYLKTNVFPGGFSEYIRLPSENVKHTVKLMPAAMTFSEAAFMEPLACCLRGFHRLDVQPGDNYLVIGLGPIGMLFCEIAKAYNAGFIAGVDIDQWRIDFATSELGINAAINSIDQNLKQMLEAKELPSFDHVIITVGNGKVYQDALNYIWRGTCVLVFAECPENQEITMDPNLVYRNELSIVGSYSSSPRFLTMALDLIGNGAINVKHLITHEFPADDIQQAMALATKAQQSLKVMIKF